MTSSPKATPRQQIVQNIDGEEGRDWLTIRRVSI